MQLAFDPAPTTIRIHRCGYVSKCKARGCLERATLVAEKVDVAGRHIRQIELCLPHCDVVIARERKRGLEISDRAIGTKALPPPRWWRNAPNLDARISSTTEPAGADSTTSKEFGDGVTFVEERAEFAVEQQATALRGGKNALGLASHTCSHNFNSDRPDPFSIPLRTCPKGSDDVQPINWTGSPC